MSDTPITDQLEKSFGEMPGRMRQIERQNKQMRAALIEIWDLIPDAPKLPLIHQIRGIVQKAISK